MCLTAGATRFPYWRFFLADFAGAVLSIPLFVGLGYWFAGMIPTLQKLVGEVQLTLLVLAVVVLGVLLLVYRRRRQARHSRRDSTIVAAATKPETTPPRPSGVARADQQTRQPIASANRTTSQ